MSFTSISVSYFEGRRASLSFELTSFLPPSPPLAFLFPTEPRARVKASWSSLRISQPQGRSVGSSRRWDSSGRSIRDGKDRKEGSERCCERRGSSRLPFLPPPSHPTIYAQAHHPLLSNSPNSVWPSKSFVKVLPTRLSLLLLSSLLPPRSTTVELSFRSLLQA